MVLQYSTASADMDGVVCLVLFDSPHIHQIVSRCLLVT